MTAFETSVIGYIPRETCTWSAIDLVESPSLLLPTREAAEISARVTLHTFDVLSGTVPSLIGKFDQAEALASLREARPQPLPELVRLLASSSRRQ